VKKNDLAGFPIPSADEEIFSSNKKVLVTGCYDWFHSGHVRFFEETCELGDLYVVVGSDENVHFLKGEGHPLLPE
jgi:cytidyltransferase-like protein